MTAGEKLPSIGVLGSGPVGQGIAELLSRAGYAVSLGTRHPQSATLDRLPSQVRRATFQQAAQADCVFLAVLHSASRDLVTSLKDQLNGKLLIDTDNAWLPGHAQAAGLIGSLTEGSWMAQLLPQAHVTRAFSHIDWDKLVPAATNQPDTWAVGYAADDQQAATQLETLIRAMRYLPYRVGTLAGSAAIDVGGELWPGMYTPTDMHTILTAAGSTSSGLPPTNGQASDPGSSRYET